MLSATFNHRLNRALCMLALCVWAIVGLSTFASADEELRFPERDIRFAVWLSPNGQNEPRNPGGRIYVDGYSLAYLKFAMKPQGGVDENSTLYRILAEIMTVTGEIDTVSAGCLECKDAAVYQNETVVRSGTSRLDSDNVALESHLLPSNARYYIPASTQLGVLKELLEGSSIERGGVSTQAYLSEFFLDASARTRLAKHDEEMKQLLQSSARDARFEEGLDLVRESTQSIIFVQSAHKALNRIKKSVSSGRHRQIVEDLQVSLKHRMAGYINNLINGMHVVARKGSYQALDIVVAALDRATRDPSVSFDDDILSQAIRLKVQEVISPTTFTQLPITDYYNNAASKIPIYDGFGRTIVPFIPAVLSLLTQNSTVNSVVGVAVLVWLGVPSWVGARQYFHDRRILQIIESLAGVVTSRRNGEELILPSETRGILCRALLEGAIK